MIKDLLIYFSTIAQICLFFNAILWLWRYKYLPAKIKRLGAFIMLNLMVELYATYLTGQNISNLFLLHFFTGFEFLAWSYFYYFLFLEKKYFQKIFPWLVGTVSVLIVFNTIYLEPLSGFNSNAKTLVQLLFISYSILYFFDAFGKIDMTQATPRAISFINFAVLLYYSGSLFIFMFSKFLMNHGVTSKQQFGFWAINSLLLIIFQLLIFFSLWIVAFRKAKF